MYCATLLAERACNMVSSREVVRNHGMQSTLLIVPSVIDKENNKGHWVVYTGVVTSVTYFYNNM